MKRINILLNSLKRLDLVVYLWCSHYYCRGEYKGECIKMGFDRQAMNPYEYILYII